MGEGDLQAVFDRELADWLRGKDAEIIWARRWRWAVLVAGLAPSIAIFAWAWRSNTEHDILLEGAFALAVGTLLVFWVMTGSISDEIRQRMLAVLATHRGLSYAPDAQDFPVRAFAVLGLAGVNSIRLADRLSGQIPGGRIEIATGRLADQFTEFKQSRFIVRHDGILLHADLGAPLPGRFLLVPGEAPEGDAAGLAMLTPSLRDACADIAALVQGGRLRIGCDGTGFALAWETGRRFEIGPLRPPMADPGRLEHLAAQVDVLLAVPGRLRDALRPPVSDSA